MKKEKESIDEQTMLQDKLNEARTVRKVVFILLTTFTCLILAVIITSFFYLKSALGPMDPDSKEEIDIEIPLGSTTTEVGSMLKNEGLIKNATLFYFYVKFKNSAMLQAGNYTLSPAMSIDDIIEELQHGKVMEEPLFRVTIPEGKTLEEIATIFSKALNFTEEEFLDVANDRKFIEKMIERFPNLLTDELLEKDLYMPLEGYLFAGTYDIYDESIGPELVIEMMLERTDELLESKSELIKKSDFTIHEILTLASVIEREAKFAEDRPKVAQVYLNRLENDMRLQSDITAFYGLKHLNHKQVVTYEDIEVKTPYNTYLIDGLPIGPIDSPSEASIDAVLEPEGEDFNKLYYFSRPNGETFYSDTFEEHKQIKQEYRHEWYELENNDKSEK